MEFKRAKILFFPIVLLFGCSILVLFGGSESLRLVFSLSSSRFPAPLMFFTSTFPAASPSGRDPLLVILLVTARRPAPPELEWSRCRSRPGSPFSMCPFQSISNAKKIFRLQPDSNRFDVYQVGLDQTETYLNLRQPLASFFLNLAEQKVPCTHPLPPLFTLLTSPF